MLKEKGQILEAGCVAVPVALRLMLRENYTGNWQVDQLKIAEWVKRIDERCGAIMVRGVIETGQKKYKKEELSTLDDLWKEFPEDQINYLRRMALLVTIASFTSEEDIPYRVQEVGNLDDGEIDELLLQLGMKLSKEEKVELKRTLSSLVC